MIRAGFFLLLMFGWASWSSANPGAMMQAMLRTTQTACWTHQASWTPQYANLQGYWKLDGTGTLAVGGAIPSVLGPAGTMGGVAGTFAAARMGQGLTFNGSSNYATFGTSFTNLDSSNLTVSTWIKLSAYPSQFMSGMIDKEFDSPDPTVYGGWGFWMGQNGHPWFWLQGNKDIKDNGPVAVGLNTWTMVSATLNVSTKTVKFYINGVLNSVQTDASIVIKPSGASASLTFGSIRGGAGVYASYDLPGTLDDVAAWNVELTAEEIKRVYDNQACQ